MDCKTIYLHLRKIIEDVNIIINSYILEEVNSRGKSVSEAEKEIEEEEKEWFFDPVKGNVGFGSAIDCWGFTIPDFAKLVAPKLKITPKKLS